MPRPDSQAPITDRRGPPTSLTDEDITTVRVDRRSFLSRAITAGSVAAGAALATGCGGATDSDSSDSDAQASDSDSSDSGGEEMESQSSDSDAPATDSDSSDSAPEATDSDSSDSASQ